MIIGLENKLLQYACESNKNIRKMSFLLALSGGVDSMVLAHMLIKLREKFNFFLTFVHINHNSTHMSIKMQNAVSMFSKMNDVMLYSENIFIQPYQNFESDARLKRYYIIKRIVKENIWDFTNNLLKKKN